MVVAEVVMGTQEEENELEAKSEMINNLYSSVDKGNYASFPSCASCVQYVQEIEQLRDQLNQVKHRLHMEEDKVFESIKETNRLTIQVESL